MVRLYEEVDMKRKRIFTILVLVLLTCALSTTAFAIDESEVESAIAASSQEEVSVMSSSGSCVPLGFQSESEDR